MFLAPREEFEIIDVPADFLTDAILIGVSMFALAERANPVARCW